MANNTDSLTDILAESDADQLLKLAHVALVLAADRAEAPEQHFKAIHASAVLKDNE